MYVYVYTNKDKQISNHAPNIKQRGIQNILIYKNYSVREDGYKKTYLIDSDVSKYKQNEY